MKYKHLPKQAKEEEECMFLRLCWDPAHQVHLEMRGMIFFTSEIVMEDKKKEGKVGKHLVQDAIVLALSIWDNAYRKAQ